MAYPNQRINGPFGDIYQVGSPYLDKLSDRLYREEQAEKLQRARDEKVMEDGFAKELANVKSVDVPEIVNLYNDYKAASKGLIKKGTGATVQDNQDLLLKKANFYKGIKASIEDKERIKKYNEGIRGDRRGMYAPDAMQKATTYLNTPTSKRLLDNDQSELFYQYSVPNLEKHEKAAQGVPRDVTYLSKEKSVKGDLYDDEEIIKVGNNPNKFFDNYLGSIITDPQGARNFAGVMDNKYSDEEKEELTNKYLAKISDPKYIELYGKVQPFNPLAMQTRLGQAVALRTMESVVDTPLEGVKRSVPNKEKQKWLDFDIWSKKNGITFGQRKQMAQQQHEYQKAMKFGYGNQWLDNEWKNVKENPVDTLIYTNTDGKQVEVKVLGASSKFKKYFESQGYEPDEVIMYPDGTYGGVVYKRDEKTGEIIETEGKKKPVKSLMPVKLNEEQAKIAYGNSITTGKDLTEELSPAEQKVLEEKEKSKSKGFTLNASQRRR